MNKNRIFALMLVMIFSLALIGCDSKNTENQNESLVTETQQTSSNEENNESQSVEELYKPNRDFNRYANVEQNPQVTIEMENGGVITLELYPKIAPESVENFIELINEGFYDGLIFHRTIPGFMAQGGDPEGYGMSGPGYSIYGEFAENGFENSLSHTRGVISMARAEDMNTAGSQFFIVVDDSATFLDGKYAAFGKVLEGMDIVDEIVNSEVIRREIDITSVTTEEEYYEYIKQSLELDRPINPPVIKTVTVDTFGVEYEAPTKLNVEIEAE